VTLGTDGRLANAATNLIPVRRTGILPVGLQTGSGTESSSVPKAYIDGTFFQRNCNNNGGGFGFGGANNN
jgi:hypothetical protein